MSHSHDHKDGAMDCCASGECGGGGCCDGANEQHSHDHAEVQHKIAQANASGKLQVHIAYWSGWGYQRFATALESFLNDEFGNKIAIVSGKAPGGTTGAFEVTVGGKKVHSKLENPGVHGKVQTDAELDNIIDNINAVLG